MLSLKDPTRYPDPLAGWPLPLEVSFVDSRELSWLKEDLNRYAHGRVRGRSYLIAGHRGSGKTALVHNAVDQLAAAIMRESVKTNGQLEPGPFQRPLLVKLHGPSMLEPTDWPFGGQAAGPEVGVKDGAAPKAAAGGDGNAGEDAAKVRPTEKDEIRPGSHAALVQITVGLYRALAAEATTGFRAHARLAASRRSGDQAELATQLALDLDGGVPPAKLRFYWGALGRLADGILWPQTADESLKAHGVADQGMREIVALATAAQTFQVCTGRISYSETNKDQVVRKEVAEAKGESNLKDALLRLGTLGLGALTGVSILGISRGAGDAGTVASLLGGLAVWLIGSLSLSWSSSRTRTDDRSVDYSFIRDFSLGTLGRDLPVVIARVRDAGLAPVFVVDELDKVAGAPVALMGLIGKLKHLVADFGFFCFLVDRDCFDAIDARIRSTAYPPEHTLYSERLLMRPDPTYMLRYVAGLVEADAAEAQSGLARVAFALATMHDARLNLTELMRQLAHAPLYGLTRPGSRDLGDAATLLTQRRLVVATVQVAIEQALRSSRLSARMDASSSFAQLAVDALYYPSRLWGGGILQVDPSRQALKSHLEQRRKGSAFEGGASPQAAADMEPGHLDLLQEHLALLLGWLGDLEELRLALRDRNALGAPGATQPDDVRLAELLPRDVKAICELCDDGTYRFLFTQDGDLIVADPGRLGPTQVEDATESLDFARAFEALLREVGATVDEIARTPLISSVNGVALGKATPIVESALRRGAVDPEIQQHLSTLARLRAEVGGRADGLARLLLIVASLTRDVAAPTPILPAIARLIPFGTDPERWIRGLDDLHTPALPGRAEELRRWTADLPRQLLPSPGSVGLDAPPDYRYLAARLGDLFEQSRGEFVPDYPTLLQAARGWPLAATLASDLTTLTAGDWSRLCLLAVPTRDTPAQAPYWLFIAGLRGLGFAREGLVELSAADIAQELSETQFRWLFEVDGSPPEACLDVARRFAASAPTDRPPGILVVEHEGERFGGDPPSPKRPVLIVDARDLDDYQPALNWLAANGILAGRSVGVSEDQWGGP